MYAQSSVWGPIRHPVLVRALAEVGAEQLSELVEVIRGAKRGTLRTRAGAFTVRPQVVGPEQTLVLTLDADDLDLASLEIDSLEFCLGDEIFAIEADALSVRNETLRMHRPQRVLSTCRRGVELDRGAASLRVDWDGSPLELPLVEFALDEIVVTGFALAPLDLRRRAARLRVGDGDDPLELDCEVCFRGFGNVAEVRLQFQVAPADRTALARAFARFKFPRLRERGSFAPEQVIELFEASGYLDLRATEERPRAPWCRPEFAGDLSIDRIYEAEDGSLLGHVSVTRAYSRAWLGHQLSTLKGHRESAACRAALYNHFAAVPTLIDGREDVYLLGYYDRSLRWHQLFFEGFVDWLGDAGEVATVAFDRFEPLAPIEGSAAANLPEPDEFTIAPATAAELGEAAALVQAQLPALAAAAFDIDAERLVASHLHEAYAQRGVERGRAVLLARERGELVGVALCETGSPDLSLFNLFNLAQIYARSPAISRAAHVGLVRAARRFYAARGIGDPVLVTPPRQFDQPEAAGLRLDETMGCIIWSGRSLDAYPRYLRECFAKIDAASLTKAS